MTNWIKNSFESTSNKTSSKRITGFWFVVLTTLVVLSGIRNIIYCKELPTNFLYFLGIMMTSVLLIFMVITAENLIQIVKAIRNSKDV